MNSSIVSAVIATICAGSIGAEHNQACVSGTEAMASQTGADAKIERWEKNKARNIEKKTKAYLGTAKTETMAAFFLFANTISGKATIFQIGKGPFNEKYELGTNSKDVKLDVKWDF